MHSHKPNPLVVKMIKLGESGSGPETLSGSTDPDADPLNMSVGDAKENDELAETTVDPLDVEKE